MENEIEKAKPIPFLDDLDKKWNTNEGWNWIHGVFEKKKVKREDEQSQKFEGKTEKDLKTASIFAKHAFFATEVSRHTVASPSRQSTQGQNFEKFIKCFSRLEGLPASESRAEPRKSLSNPRD